MNSGPKFVPVMCNSEFLGFEQRTEHHLFFFGTRHATLENLKETYPNIRFFRMKQEHGDRLTMVPTPSESEPRADAIWCAERNAGVVVSTADCVPILIACNAWVTSIHAGWRGVLNGITLQTLRSLLANHGDRTDRVLAFIGPHIQQEHFDFDQSDAQPFYDLANSLRIDPETALRKSPIHENKVKISLKEFIHAQLKASGSIAPLNIDEFLVDTYSHKDFHSYRRDKVAGRNLSFVARL